MQKAWFPAPYSMESRPRPLSPLSETGERPGAPLCNVAERPKAGGPGEAFLTPGLHVPISTLGVANSGGGRIV